jgi:hypothetical protein
METVRRWCADGMEAVRRWYADGMEMPVQLGWRWPLFGRQPMLNVATYCATVSSNSAGQQD